MSKAKKIKTRDLWRQVIFEKYSGLCARCLSKGRITNAHDAHHIVHKTQGLALRYSIDNGVALCRTCHLIDNTGDLLPWCIAHIGMNRYNELLALKHPVKIGAVIKTLDDYIEILEEELR